MLKLNTVVTLILGIDTYRLLFGQPIPRHAAGGVVNAGHNFVALDYPHAASGLPLDGVDQCA